MYPGAQFLLLCNPAKHSIELNDWRFQQVQSTPGELAGFLSDFTEANQGRPYLIG